MSTKNIEIPYQLLTQSAQTVSYPADSLYCQTMNAPSDITLDLYLNNSLTETKTIKPNYEMNLENINIDEVIIKLNDNNETNFTPLTSVSLSDLSGAIYQILATDTYIYVMTSTNFYQLNFDGSINNSFNYSDSSNFNGINILTTDEPLPTSKFFIINNNIIYITFFNSITYELYIFTYNINLNLIKSINTHVTYVNGVPNFTYIHFYNEKIFIYTSSNFSIEIFDLNLNFLQKFKVTTNYLTFNKNSLFVEVNIDTIVQYSLDSLTMIGSTNVETNNFFNFLYSENLNISYLILLNALGKILIGVGTGNNISNINVNNMKIISNINNNGFLSFVKFGYLVILTPTGLYIYNSNLILIYSQIISLTSLYNFLTYNNSSIYYLSGTNTLNILNYNIPEPINNPNYPNDFNLILGCKC